MAPAPASKPVALQITLIGFVLTTLMLGVTTYMFHRSYSDAQKDQLAAKAEAAKANTMWKNSDNEVTALKKLVGLPLDRVFDPNNSTDATTVVGAGTLRANQAGANAGADLVQTIDKLLAALGATDENRKQIVDELAKQNTETLALKDRYANMAAEHDKAKQAAEKDKLDLISKRDEQLAAKDQEIARLRKDYNESQAEIANISEQRERERKKHVEEVAKLELINDKIREELDQIKQISFEVADGLIRRVDNSARVVWINLGSADKIRPRITFAVYAKDNSGIGRGQEDIKGKVEVTRIIDAHMCEAKILEEDLYRPMAPNDLVYSPLWNPGRTERFSLIGGMDLDGDGRSDRTLLHQIIATNGAEIDNEVDDEGNRTGDGITEKTKFLVLGDVPDLSEIARPEDREKAQKVVDHLKDMRKEARLAGVRIVNLNDFLAYCGYKPKRRLFQPGQDRPFNLTAGAHSETVDQKVARNRESAGNVSKRFIQSRVNKQDVSSGNTSGVYGAKK